MERVEARRSDKARRGKKVGWSASRQEGRMERVEARRSEGARRGKKIGWSALRQKGRMERVEAFDSIEFSKYLNIEIKINIVNAIFIF
jgi:hypothetical protein